MPKISTMAAITSALGAINLALAIAQRKKWYVVLSRALATLNWVIATVIYLKLEREDAERDVIDAADEDADEGTAAVDVAEQPQPAVTH